MRLPSEPSFCIPLLRMKLGGMFPIGFTQNKVLIAVICAISIYMMNGLTLAEHPAYTLLDNKPMLADISDLRCVWMVGFVFIQIPADVYYTSTPLGVVDTIPRSTLVATKLTETLTWKS